MQGGIWPFRPSDSRSSAVTRDACFLPQVTPGQLQYWRVLFHEARALVLLERWFLRQRSAWKSLLDSSPSMVPSNEEAGAKEVKKVRRAVTVKSDELRVPTATGYLCYHGCVCCYRVVQ
ncbi:hypothetical protein VPH35_130322 [Triticum aestivum]